MINHTFQVCVALTPQVDAWRVALMLSKTLWLTWSISSTNCWASCAMEPKLAALLGTAGTWNWQELFFLLGTRVFRWLRLRNSIFYTIHVYAIFTDPWMVDFLWEIYQSHGSYGVRNQLKNTPESSTEAMNVGHWNWGPSKQKRQRSIYTPEN